MSPLALGMLLLSLQLVFFWLTGAFSLVEGADFWLTPVQTIGSALTLSTTTSFMVAVSRYLKQQTGGAFDQLVASGTVSRESAAPGMASLLSLTSTQKTAAAVAGIFFAWLNVPWPLVIDDLEKPIAITSAGIALGTVLVWLIVALALTRRLVASNSLRVLGREHAKVDLLRMDGLLPFGRVGTLDLAMVLITLSFTAFQSLDAELRWSSYRNSFIVGFPFAIGLLLSPMIGIRQNVRAAKHAALEKLDAAIALAERKLEAQPLHYLNDLLRHRTAIKSAREWPLDTTAFSRIAIYIVIPPIAWVGSAVADVLIQTAIAGG
jgi:hypothetical protein